VSDHLACIKQQLTYERASCPIKNPIYPGRGKQLLRLSDVASASGASANERNLLPDMPTALCKMLIGLRQVQQLDIEIWHGRVTQLAMGF